MIDKQIYLKQALRSQRQISVIKKNQRVINTIMAYVNCTHPKQSMNGGGDG